MKDSWRELWWHMAKGSQTEYERIKALDVFEFYTVRDLWESEIRARNAAARQQQNKK
jgi:hypothetical protein